MREKLRVAVIGAGRIGSLHAAHIATRFADVDLVAISDVVEDVAGQCARAHDISDVYTDYRRVFDRRDIDAVVVCSSTDTHAEIITGAARSGKHIFCEKPIDYDLKRIDGVLGAVEEAGVKFQVGFNRRFDPSFRRVKQSVVSGEIGAPHIIRITSRDPSPPPISYIKVSGGMFFDMTIHDFDMARFLAGCEVDDVFVRGAVLVDPKIGEAGDIDTALISLSFENGSVGSIDNSRQAVYGYDQRVEVFGSQGMVEAGNEYPNTAVISDTASIKRDLPLNFFMERYTESYIQELREFFTSVFDNTAPPVTGQDGKMPVVMAMAAYKSLSENRPVKLSEFLS